MALGFQYRRGVLVQFSHITTFRMLVACPKTRAPGVVQAAGLVVWRRPDWGVWRFGEGKG